MFDGISLYEGISDLYDNGIHDDFLKILFEANNKIFMRVKTDFGPTDKKVINSSVLQGNTWGTAFASVQADNLVKDVDTSIKYKYKDLVDISCLGMVDDILGVAEAGYKSQELNAYINIQSALKKIAV